MAQRHRAGVQLPADGSPVPAQLPDGGAGHGHHGRRRQHHHVQGTGEGAICKIDLVITRGLYNYDRSGKIEMPIPISIQNK